MNKIFITLSLSILFYTIAIESNSQQSLKKKITSFFSSRTAEKVNQQELPAESITSLSINALNGSITIKTGPKKSLCVKSTVRAKKQDYLKDINVIIDTHKNNHLAISTECVNKKITGIVDYELIVPAHIHISVNVSGKGNVSIKDVEGKITVVAQDAISIGNTKEIVIAKTVKKGSIDISNTAGPVELHTLNGNITGHNIGHTFHAHSTKGKVNVSYNILPSTSSITVKTISGNIALALPADTDAEIKGYTERGKLTSDLYVTLNPYTTKLNSIAWDKFRKEVDGFFGTGEALINLHSMKGNISITPLKTT